MEYAASALILIGIFVILATSFNLIIGFGGLMSIAHPIFFALGAYTSGLATTRLGLPIGLAMPMGALVALAASVLLSLPALRVSGDYLVIASIGVQLGMLQIIKNLDWTGGPGGLVNIPPLFASVGWRPAFAYVTLVLVSALAAILLVRWIVGGDYGRAITAMRDDEEAFKALGRNAVSIKIVLFAIGSGLAGYAGGLYAHYFLYVTPEQFEILYSSAMLTMVVVGGLGTIWGPALGAVLLETLPQAVKFLDFPSSVMAPVQGILFTGLVLFFLFAWPQGLVGARRALHRPEPEEEVDEAGAADGAGAGAR